MTAAIPLNTDQSNGHVDSLPSVTKHQRMIIELNTTPATGADTLEIKNQCKDSIASGEASPDGTLTAGPKIQVQEQDSQTDLDSGSKKRVCPFKKTTEGLS